MKLICIAISLTIIGVSSQDDDDFDCSYGYFDENPDENDKCMFNCEYDNNYVEINTLSFQFIKDRCSGVSAAAALYPSDCNSLNDLVYSDTSCRCPYCKCSTKDTDGETGTVYSYGPRQACYNCTCSDTSDANTIYGIDEMVYDCDYLHGTSSALSWNHYGCPPETCMETDYNGNEYERNAGNYWWDDVGDSDTKCTEFCYCSAKDGKVCATGYNNIVANDVLADIFHYDCGGYNDVAACWDIDSQSFDTSRFFTTDTGPTCGGNCPKCDCDGRAEGAKWYIEWQEYEEIATNEARCSECECKSDGSGNLYADCESSYYTYDDGEYVIGTRSCPPEEEDKEDYYTCHSQDGTTASVGTLNAVNCTASGDEEMGSQYEYCSWTYTPDTFSDSDSDDPYDWGCGGGASCEAFADNGCAYVDVDVETTDCYGDTTTYTLETYLDCCRSGENCNREDISTSSCTRSTDYENLFTTYIQCLFSSDGAGGALLCDDSVDSISCSDLLTIYRQYSACECELYGGIYKRVSSATQAILQKEIEGDYAYWSRWNDALGCNINLSCDLGAGGKIKNNSGVSGLVYVVGLMWTLLVGLYIM